MAAGIFALFDDVAALMDDVALMSKVAGKQSAGVTGDDFAVSASQVQGLPAHRELPVIAKIMAGSLLNKFVLTVILLIISVVAPILATVMLVIGGCYIAYEATEKVLEWSGLHHETDDEESIPETEDQKVKKALKTDLVLSTEIMIIALAATGTAPLITKAIVLLLVGVVITLFIYGIVAILIRLDDMGYVLTKSENDFIKSIGNGMITAAPKIMRGLGVIGTFAIFLVAGGIFVHTFKEIHHFIEPVVPYISSIVAEGIVGLIVGLIVVFFVKMIKKI